MPSNSMDRKLCHSIAFCSEVDPIPLNAYFTANLLRFAHSERDYLQQLHARVVGLMGDNIPLVSFTNPTYVHNLFDMPLGGLSDPPIIVNLLNAINLAGPFAAFRSGCIPDPSTKWIVSYPSTPFPSNFKSFQSAAMSALTSGLKCKDLAAHLYIKLAVTLKSLYPNGDLPQSWCGATLECLSVMSLWLCCCVL